MVRWSLGLILVVGVASAGTRLPLFPTPAKPHPAVVAMREYTARVETNLGTFRLRFFPDAAPNAVRCFIKAAERGLYDGLPLVEVAKGKMLVFGDGSKGGKVEFERSALSPVAGSVSFVRAGDGKNQVGRLRVVLGEDVAQAQGETIFAEVSEGLAVARRLGSVATRREGGRAVPVEEVLIERVVVEKKTAERK